MKKLILLIISQKIFQLQKISIVIRTFNEERWIRHCLKQVYSQDFKNFEVVIVDNQSTDKTLEIAKSFPIKKIVTIDEYFPGLALNLGVEANKANYYAFLSAHCIPCQNNWLSNLYKSINQNDQIIGVYGRQVPLPSSEEIDKRDLLMTFSCESRISKIDGFFHNANSMVKGTYFENNLFDPSVTNAEDHDWGRKVTSAGFQIAYCSDSKVYHHHGLHQGSPPKRVSGVVKQLVKNDLEELNKFPSSLTLSGIFIFVVVIIPDYLKDSIESQIDNYISITKDIECFKKVFFVLPDHHKKKINNDYSDRNFHFLRRSIFKTSKIADLKELMREILINLESNYGIPDLLLYLNAAYNNKKSNLNCLVKTHLTSNSSTTIFGGKTYQCIWANNGDGGYSPVTQDLLKPKSMREPLFIVFYGLGTIYNACDLRDHKKTNLITGIVEINDQNLTKKLLK